MFYQPEEYEREGAPKAFIYELEMFRIASEKYINSDEKDSFVNNTRLECALLHARNLLEFFTGNRPLKGNLDEDSIRAGYFVGESHKEQKGWWKSSNLSHTETCKNDINKSLSHLTFARIKGNYEWKDDLPKIRDEIEAAYSEFLTFLPEEDKSKWRARDSDVELC